MFSITDHKGFGIRFKNGYKVSVQWGPGNYCERQDYGEEAWDKPKSDNHWSSHDAEIAVWYTDEHTGLGPANRVSCCEFGQVRGRCTADEVAQVIALVQGWDRGLGDEELGKEIRMIFDD